ncbi:MAG: FtsX-like permease family protein [candidate division Zixibacteria bacterium]|nr:FtsX-like permease family protein [candidate division Zixibacteria bacterium]NIS16856.1 FtsX-like permease family protein [candidate division Zixibacteria bacterium]NIS49291.1 FtsX-like permease family protein [candidate division Zixibacteria bacterium]NIT53258.1 FtsX-like permease family protein [candidate division Zixibacteria bacterium]NIU13270.1 FtsX-like permease family protein [candidate division Zixibacteria bacterium]
MNLMFIKQILRDMRGQKLRTVLTLFGIFWGTAAVILLGAFGYGIHMNQEKAFKGLGENIVIVWGGTTSKSYQGLPRGRTIIQRIEDVEILKAQIPELKYISPEYTEWNKTVVYNDKRLVAPIVGVWPEFGDMRNIFAEMGGRFINQNDLDNRRRVCFLGNELKEQIFGEEIDPVGEMIQISGVPFRVIGVLKAKQQDSSYNSRDSRKIVIPSTTFVAIYGQNYVDNVVWKAESEQVHQHVKQRYFEIMGKRHQFDPSDRQALMTWDTTENTEFFTYFFWGFRIFLYLISIATLIVGGIGVANIMYVVVEERTREIGIKMALGAKSGFVLRQFLFETMFLTAFGGLMGFLFSATIVKFFPRLNLEEYVGIPEISAFVSLGTIIALLIIAILAGYFPARRAATMDPVKALKI